MAIEEDMTARTIRASQNIICDFCKKNCYTQKEKTTTSCDYFELDRKKIKNREQRIVDRMCEMFQEHDIFKKRKIPRCPRCKLDFIKVEEQSSDYHSTWKPNCKCNGDIHLSIG